MIFLEGQAIYYHKEDICHFLEHVHGTSNDLLKAVLLDCKEDLYMAGTKSLSYISKFITAPLWRLIESPGHILDMNENFNTLVTFLENAAAKPEVTLAFMTGNTTPFDTAVQPDDLIFSKLLEKSDQIDEIVLPLLQNLFTAIKQLLTCMIPEHLPGGKYWDASDNFRQQTRSVAKHNKMPEFIFGQLDHLISFRPNASVLTNEAFLLYSYNKTSQWLSSIPTDEKDKLMQDSIKEGREIRYKFKERIQIINEKRLKAQQEKQKELERIERERLKKAEEMTNDICFYGLWQSEKQVDEGVSRLKDDKEIVKAMQAQLKFRKNVLEQKPRDKKLFNFSTKSDGGKYKKLTIPELRTNLLELIKSTLIGETTEKEVVGIPLLVGKTVDHKFTDQTYRGKVISVVPGFPMWYNIQYAGDQAMYAYNLHLDYEKGDLQIVV